jgi:hypothetical protein
MKYKIAVLDDYQNAALESADWGAPAVQNDVDCARSYRMRFRLNNKGASIMMHSHQTAPTQFVEANGIRFAYRRFGKTGGVPLVFSQHYIHGYSCFSQGAVGCHLTVHSSGHGSRLG